MSSEETLEYDVLFYKKAGHSKVHKSKGVSKIDGILSVKHHAQIISLRCADTAVSSDEEEEDERTAMTWKDRRKKAAKSGPKGVVYSGKQHGDLIDQIQENISIVIGTYDVEVVALRRSKTVPAQKGITNNALSGAGVVRRPTKTTSLLSKTKTATTAPQTLNSRMNAVPLKRKPVARPLPQQPRKRPPAQPRKQSSEQPLPAESVYASPLARTNPPAISRKKTNVMESMSTSTTLSAKAETAASLAAAAALPAKRSPPSAWTPPSIAALTNNASVLPGIPVPAAVRSVLRPHQVTGVEFLWRALTTGRGAILGTSTPSKFSCSRAQGLMLLTIPLKPMKWDLEKR